MKTLNRMKTTRIPCLIRITIPLPVMLMLAATRLHASILWDESVNGSLSASGSSPTVLSLSDGQNAILGTVGGSAQQDWVALTVPTGFQLSSLVLASYSSTDVQGFFGVQVGPDFTGSVNSASSWLGYTHFGTGAARFSGVHPTVERRHLHVSDSATRRQHQLRIRLRRDRRARAITGRPVLPCVRHLHNTGRSPSPSRAGDQWQRESGQRPSSFGFRTLAMSCPALLS